MMAPDAFDREDYSHDPPEQIKQCLECPYAECNDCYGSQIRGKKSRYIYYKYNGIPMTTTEIANAEGMPRATVAYRIKKAGKKPGEEVNNVVTIRQKNN